MVEEIWAEFHRVIVELRKDYRAKVKLSVFFSRKITSFVRFFFNFQKIRPFDFRPNVPDPRFLITSPDKYCSISIQISTHCLRAIQLQIAVKDLEQNKK
jgi:hypothetical protein